MKGFKFKVQLGCQACANTLKAKLVKLNGVTRVNFSVEQQEIKVLGNESMKYLQVLHKVQSWGQAAQRQAEPFK